MKKVFLAAAAILFGLAATASAGTVTVSDTHTKTNGPESFDFSVAKFDASLGTLTSIEFNLSSTVSGSFTFFNTTQSQGTIYRGLRSITTAANFLISVDLEQTPIPGYLVGARQTITVDMGSLSGSKSLTKSDAATLAAYTGSGNIALPSFIGHNSTTGTVSPGLTGQLSTTSTTVSKLDVTYNFTSTVVPLPPAGLLAAPLLLLAAGGAIRRRRRRAA